MDPEKRKKKKVARCVGWLGWPRGRRSWQVTKAVVCARGVAGGYLLLTRCRRKCQQQRSVRRTCALAQRASRATCAAIHVCPLPAGLVAVLRRASPDSLAPRGGRSFSEHVFPDLDAVVFFSPRACCCPPLHHPRLSLVPPAADAWFAGSRFHTLRYRLAAFLALLLAPPDLIVTASLFATTD